MNSRSGMKTSTSGPTAKTRSRSVVAQVTPGPLSAVVCHWQ